MLNLRNAFTPARGVILAAGLTLAGCANSGGDQRFERGYGTAQIPPLASAVNEAAGCPAYDDSCKRNAAVNAGRVLTAVNVIGILAR